MGIVNKRNAVVGWVVLKVGKRVVKKKAQGAVTTGKRTGGAAPGAPPPPRGPIPLPPRKRGGPSDE